MAPLARRARGNPLEQIVPVGLGGLRDMIGRFLEAGFSKFIVRPLGPPEDWRAELDVLAARLDRQAASVEAGRAALASRLAALEADRPASRGGGS